MISNNKYRYIEIADSVSKLSNYSIRVGAVIERGGNVLSVGHNKVFSDNNIRRYNGRNVRSIHAELMAIVKAGRNVEGSTIYIVSRKKDGNFRVSRPCNVCLSAIEEVGIRYIVYFDGESFVREKVK